MKMKKLLLSLCCLLITVAAFGQTYPVRISGTVTELGTGNPLANYPVEIRVDSAVGGGAIFGYNNTVYTDAAGYYADTVLIPGYVSCGYLNSRVLDCNSVYAWHFNNFCPSPNNFPNQDFQICTGGGSGNTGRIIGLVLLGTGNPGGGPPADNAEVYLIKHDAFLGTLTAVDTALTDTSGYYWFDSIAQGDYLIKAALLPGSSQYWNYLPTYWGDVLFWSSATTANVPQNAILTPTPINLIAGVNPGGPGFVGGLISQGANKTTAPGDPIEHVQVMLLNMNNSPVQYTYSDALGNFSMTNIAYGTYQLWAEIPGKTTLPVIVEINAQNPSITGVHIEVNTTDIVLGAEGNAPVSPLALSVYPNPAHHQVNLSLELPQAGEVKAQLMDLSGRVVTQFARNYAAGNQVISFDLEVPAGLYLLNVEAAGNSHSIKLMVD